MATMALPSPLPTRQLFSAGTPSVESRTNPTGTAATPQQRVSTDHNNDCITIKVATYNIRDGRKSNLEAALRACKQMRIDVGALTETRLSTDRYTRSEYGYTVFATQTTHTNQGGIALIFTNFLYFQIESQQKHGPNVISCILVTGTHRYPIIGAYIPPTDTTTLHYISIASERFTGQPIILIKETLRIAGLFPMEEYLNRRKRYLEEYTAEHPQLLQECHHALTTGNTTRRVFWWNQKLTDTTT
jgi:exonuclease III